MTDAEITPEQLATALVGRLIHDVMGPASGIVSAFDLIADPSAAAMRDEALDLAAESARALVDLLVVSRAIYAGGAAMAAGELRAFAERLFTGSRATWEISIGPAAISPSAGRLLLGLVQIAAAGVAAGGVVTARLASRGDRLVVEGSATGPRLRVGQEILRGLAGQAAGDAPLHRWSAAYLLSEVAGSAGGTIEASVGDGVFLFRADIRADMA